MQENHPDCARVAQHALVLGSGGYARPNPTVPAQSDNGGTIRRELNFQTRVRVLASTSIPIGNVGDGKKNNETTEDILSGR